MQASENNDKKYSTENVKLHTMQLGSCPITLPVEADIEVQEGCCWNHTTPMRWSICVDQHDLRAIATLEEHNMIVTINGWLTNVTLPLYSVRMVGNLSYHQVLEGLCTMTGDALHDTMDFCTTQFIWVDQFVGYVESLAELEIMMQQGYSINVITQNPYVILTDGTQVTYDPNDPSIFYHTFDGTPTQFVQLSSVFINPNIGPVS